MYHETRGRELPGNYNHSLLQGLFHVQSASWGKVSRSHVGNVVALVNEYLASAFKFVVKDATVCDKLWKHAKIALDKNVEGSHEELARLLQDEQAHPITYNHYYTDNIQKARSDGVKELIESTVKNVTSQYTKDMAWMSEDAFNTRLVSWLQDPKEVNMVDRACSEALTDLNAYYKVIQPHSDIGNHTKHSFRSP